MKRTGMVLVFIAVALILGGWWIARTRDAKRGSMSSPAATPKDGMPRGARPEAVPGVNLPAAVAAPAAAPPAGGETEVRRVYRLALENGRASLEAVQDVRGDFHRRRGQTRSPGMIACRLLDSQRNLLAEETLHAPDAVCIVLDPNTRGDGTPQAAELTPQVPVLFEVRMPRFDEATTMEIFRLETSPRLLATIPLRK